MVRIVIMSFDQKDRYSEIY